MPIIDVSQSSYRALVIAAHKRGMSVDRFIEYRIARKTEAVDECDEINARRVTVVDAERTGARLERHSADPSFEALWGRIERNAGTQISTKRGQGFTYGVEAGYLIVHQSGARVPRSQFKKALAQWPATGPSTMRGVYAASVVWAVLTAFVDRQVMANAA